MRDFVTIRVTTNALWDNVEGLEMDGYWSNNPFSTSKDVVFSVQPEGDEKAKVYLLYEGEFEVLYDSAQEKPIFVKVDETPSGSVHDKLNRILSALGA